MSEILQGTTPSLKIVINKTDFLVSSIVKLELAMTQKRSSSSPHDISICTHGLEDVYLDTANNTITYTFTEAETLSMLPDKPLLYQLRFLFADGSIVGTKRMSLQVADLMSEEVMSG